MRDFCVIRVCYEQTVKGALISLRKRRLKATAAFLLFTSLASEEGRVDDRVGLHLWRHLQVFPWQHRNLLLVLLLYRLSRVLEIGQAHLLPRRRVVIINELSYCLHREPAVWGWQALVVLVVSSNRVLLYDTFVCLRPPRRFISFFRTVIPRCRHGHCLIVFVNFLHLSCKSEHRQRLPAVLRRIVVLQRIQIQIRDLRVHSCRCVVLHRCLLPQLDPVRMFEFSIYLGTPSRGGEV